MKRPSRSTVITLAASALVFGAIALVPIEALIARNRDYLPDDPGFTVDTHISGTDPELTMAVVGDSTVAGLGVDHERDSLPVQIAERVAEQTGRAVHVVGYGVSGAETREVLKKQMPKVGNVDVLVVEAGSNDVTAVTSLHDVSRDTRQLLNAATERGNTVILGSAGRMDAQAFLQPLRSVVAWRSRKVRKRQRSEAKRANVGFVDIGGSVGERYNETPGSTSSDGFHPSKIGYGIWADALAGQVVKRRKHPVGRH